jgi:hypothetical protein
MPTLDEAIRFIANFARAPGPQRYPSYGYEIYLTNVIHAYRRDVDGVHADGFLGQGQEARAMSPVFYEAAWELCRRGILRPGLKEVGGQATDDGSSGNGYSITASGRAWLEQVDEAAFIPMEPGRFAAIIARFRQKLGDGYFQRAQEAAKCHFATAYLACCVMSGAAAESILLRIAITKEGDEERVLQIYRRASGRRDVENLVVGQARQPLAGQFRNLMDLLKYWRDEAAHGTVSEISEFEAYEAMARLLRLAHFADDHWNELTRSAQQI